MAETIGVLGAGALGTLLATRLHRAGHTVHVYARTPARREALSQEGSPLHAEGRPEGLGPATLIFLCVKSYDTRSAAHSIAGAGVASAICSLQNGWGNGPRIALKKAGPSTSAGKTLTTSAPASQAVRISVGVKQPGMTSLS